ncbi:sulfatase family protein [Lutimonas sp.]|uniref:sulfatase family protein n=1 Tax=Lutimonas sp. TaxID=1872403 RepID=UPI003D9B3956
MRLFHFLNGHVLIRFKFILFLFLYTTASICAQTKNQKKSDPPNVIIIFMDDLGYGDISLNGHPTIQTPNIDKMAREGQIWTSFYAASSVCSPSRGALLTGRYPVRIGLGGEKQRVFFPESKGGLPEGETTIAEMLKENGYKTGMVGKWHLGHLPEFLPTNQGFDSYYGIPYSNDMNGVKWGLETFFSPPDIHMWQVPLMENEKIIELPADQFTITKRYTEKAVEFIEDHKTTPFFLYMAHSMVHTPLFASTEFQNSSKRGLFGDVMNEVDWSVGEVLKTLRKLGLEENTLVIFTSDNGPWLMMQEMGGSAGLLRDGKGTTWEGGMRVPGIFYMPGTIKKASVEGIGSTLDLLPTIAAITNSELPENTILDGYDLSKVLKENSPSPRDHFFYYRKQEIYAARLGSFKSHFITETCYQKDNNKIIRTDPLLFQLDHDPGEYYNRAKDHPEVLLKIEKLVSDHLETVSIKTSELDKY